MAALLALTAVHLTASAAGLLFVVAGALALVALLTDGPFGAWKLLSRRLHRMLDWVLVAAVAGSPLLTRSHGLMFVLLAESIALGLALLARRTTYRSAPRRRRANPEPTVVVASAGARTNNMQAVAVALGRARREAPRALGRLVGKKLR